MIYLDYNATTPMRPEAIEAFISASQVFGNPSSVHGAGREARRILDSARRDLADCVDASASRLLFTSGGTEANALAMNGYKRILYSAIEHDCVRENAKLNDPNAVEIPVLESGVIDVAALPGLLQPVLQGCDAQDVLVVVMLSNNETGVIQPIKSISECLESFGVKIHCDAVQAFGKMPFTMDDLGVHSLSLSAHKFGGPKGVGALLHKEPANLKALVLGGGQEKRKRSGTENVAGAHAMATAAQQAQHEMQDDMRRIGALRDQLEQSMKAAVPEAVVYGADVDRVANTTTIGLPGLRNETQVMMMDLAGVSVSSGSACSSGKVTPSHVLSAMGVDSVAATESLRFSLGWQTTPHHVESAVKAWVEMAERHLGRVAS